MNVLKKWLASDYLKSDILGDKPVEEKFQSFFERMKE